MTAARTGFPFAIEGAGLAAVGAPSLGATAATVAAGFAGTETTGLKVDGAAVTGFECNGAAVTAFEAEGAAVTSFEGVGAETGGAVTGRLIADGGTAKGFAAT